MLPAHHRPLCTMRGLRPTRRLWSEVGPRPSSVVVGGSVGRSVGGWVGGVCVLSEPGLDVQNTCSSQAPCVCDSFLYRKCPLGGFQDSEPGFVELLSPIMRHTWRSPYAWGLFPARGEGRTISLGFKSCLSVAATWRRCLRVVLFGGGSIRIPTEWHVRTTPAERGRAIMFSIAG